MEKTKIFILFLVLLIIAISGCKKTGEALNVDYSSQMIVLGDNEDPSIVTAAIDAAGALGITNSGLDSDYPDGIDAKSIPDLMIIGTYTGGKFSNSLLSSYITSKEFTTEEEAIILIGSPLDSPIHYTIIVGNTVDITVRAIEVLKMYGLDGSYANELSWGFTRIRWIVQHCFDKVKNADEEGVDCGGSCSACGSTLLKTIRTLPAVVEVNTPFTVAINLDLDDDGTEAVAVEETLPAGCSMVGSSNLSLTPTTPTWFFSNNPAYPLSHNLRYDVTFTYDVICANVGTLTFSGQVASISLGSIKTKGHTSVVS